MPYLSQPTKLMRTKLPTYESKLANQTRNFIINFIRMIKCHLCAGIAYLDVDIKVILFTIAINEINFIYRIHFIFLSCM